MIIIANCRDSHYVLQPDNDVAFLGVLKLQQNLYGLFSDTSVVEASRTPTPVQQTDITQAAPHIAQGLPTLLVQSHQESIEVWGREGCPSNPRM